MSDLQIDAQTLRQDLVSVADELAAGITYTPSEAADVALALARASDLITLLAGLEQHDAAA
ncbi:MAG: hypothetical protein M3R02_31745 [Chloroflexota bacterium]|nr:hypothetical protein [Chloroflexota bacterium]